MENLKQISVRLDPEALRKIEGYSSSHRYWKRNFVINQIVSCVMHTCTPAELYTIMRYDRFKNPENLRKFLENG